ncbi:MULTISPECIES: hypothetical protein [Stenotrophomonas]|uniref:hypothetical protein n=1 Tax=Stenotrophomonas TaxID=40323 RepID=UPI0007702C15|nr:MULTISPECIES: hypothetical protein [Stenotrophomonas]AMJ56221.1 hypothetical protein AXG53_05830 [Stenotrophomonas sp. KCTC 12332]
MTSRYRFYQWSASPKQFLFLRGRLEVEGFSEETGRGVRLTKATNSLIEGRYIQRFAYEEQEFLPSGGASTVERIGFSITEFRLRPTPCGFVIVDPPRSVSDFVMFISSLLDHDVSVQVPRLNLVSLKRFVQSELGRCHVKFVKIAGAQLAENVVADISVSDQLDALERALKLYPQHKASIGKIEMALPDLSGAKSRLIVSKTASVSTTLPRKDVEAIWGAVERACE